MPPHVRYEVAGQVATVTLDRPEKLNAMDRQMFGELEAAAASAAGDPTVRAVVVTGAGRAFSSGLDVAEFAAMSDPAAAERVVADLQRAINAVELLPKPVVAAVNGPAVGIGCSLALACDLVIARESAYLLLAFVNIGLVPDGGSSLFVPTRAGMGRAAEMAMLGERVRARTAMEWGLVNRVTPDEAFDEEVDALAERLATGPTRSYAGTKRQLNAWLFGRMEEQLELEATVQQELAASGDFAEGVQAFVEKRDARFAGE
jgi:2-(1,2-epoxy-1,2-dihydrophenyl)acetyl-CoA isomerase